MPKFIGEYLHRGYIILDRPYHHHHHPPFHHLDLHRPLELMECDHSLRIQMQRLEYLGLPSKLECIILLVFLKLPSIHLQQLLLLVIMVQQLMMRAVLMQLVEVEQL